MGSWVRHRRSRRIRSWYRHSVRITGHWLRQEPLPKGPTVLIRNPGVRFIRSHGSLLYDDVLPDSHGSVTVHHLVSSEATTAQISLLAHSSFSSQHIKIMTTYYIFIYKKKK